MVVLAFRHRLQALAYPEPVEVEVQFMRILAGLLVQAVQAVVEMPLRKQPDKVELLTQAVVGAVDGLLML
jgi:hypothetical protein